MAMAAGAAPVQADLSAEAEAAALLPSVHRTVGPVGCLVNNASEFERDEIGDMSRTSWDLHLETNLRAPALLMQDMARLLPDGPGTAPSSICSTSAC